MSNKQKWGDLLDRKVLVSPTNDPNSGPFEYIVREVSPSGTNVKLENRATRTFWCKAAEYTIDEVLPQ